MRNEEFGPVPRVAYLVYFADGMCTPSRVSFLPLSSTPGRKAIFVKSVVKNVISLFSYEFLKLLSILFANFFKAGYHFEGKILKPGEKVFLGVHTPVQFKVK